MSEQREAEWHPLEDAARAFLEEVYSQDPNLNARTYGWQDVLDSLPDHNQTMIDAIEGASPGLWAALAELMADETTEGAADLWTGMVNHIFGLAQAMHEEDVA